MSPYGFVLTWLLQGAVLGLVVLVLPRCLRMTDPRRLAWWWSSGAIGVVVLPLLPLLLPTPAPSVPPAVVRFVESTTVSFAGAVPDAGAPSPWLVLGVVWALGALARVAFITAGRRRFERLIADATLVEDDPALERARDLVPPPSRHYPLAWRPVSVIAANAATPCAFGWAHVRVLVPRTLQDLPESQRVAVYLHELLHVARGDVQRTFGDEAVRVMCWWQPAVWWLLAQLRLAREHEVDAEVVACTGDMRGYVEALVWCSTLRPVMSLGSHAGGRRHVLVQRVALMCTEGGEMSRTRRWASNAGMTVVAGVIAATLGVVAPLRATAPGEPGAAQAGAGPMERQAVMPTLDAPAPRRVINVEPVVPASPFGFRFRVHVVIDAQGHVVEARVPEVVPASVPMGELRNAWEGGRKSVLEAVRQWQFDPPARAPMLLVTDVMVGPQAGPTDAPSRMTDALGANTSAQAPLRVGGTVRPPTKLIDVAAEYPQAAKDARVAGVVIIEATIDTEGRVQDARIIRSIPLLDQAALDAVKQWRYSTTLLNGEPVPVVMTLTINFSLQ